MLHRVNRDGTPIAFSSSKRVCSEGSLHILITDITDMSVLSPKSASLLVLSVSYAFDLRRQTTPLSNHK